MLVIVEEHAFGDLEFEALGRKIGLAENRADDGAELSFLSITAVIGTPMDVTVEELAIESFYPADDQTAAALA